MFSYLLLKLHFFSNFRTLCTIFVFPPKKLVQYCNHNVWCHSRANSLSCVQELIVLTLSQVSVRFCFQNFIFFYFFIHIFFSLFKAKASKMHLIEILVSIWMPISLVFAQGFEFQDGNLKLELDDSQIHGK